MICILINWYPRVFVLGVWGLRFSFVGSDSGNHFFSTFFLSPLDFHVLWHSVMSISLFTEVKRQWAMLVLGWLTASVHYCSR